MKPTNQPDPADTSRPQADSKPASTPNADMQAEDTGTADSESENDSGSQAARAMKQTSKTEAETKR